MADHTLIDLRDAIYDRIPNAGAYVTRRKTPMASLSTDALPAQCVFIESGEGQPDGDANAGNIRLVNEDIIAISLVRGLDDPAVLEGTIDAELEAIKTALFTDPTFVQFAQPFFEGLIGTRRRWLFPQNGDRYLIELRFEMTFRRREYFDVVVSDDYHKTTLTTRPAGAGSATPAITSVIDES